MDVDGVGGVVIEKGLSKASFIGAKVFAWGALRDNRQKIYRKAQDGKLKFPVASQTLSGGAMALKKEVFENNKFDEGLIKYALGEDIEFTSRISRKGYRLVITPNAFIYHYPSPKGRYSKLQFIEAKICSKAYLIERVLSEEPKKSKYIFQYLLYLIGQLISCVIMSAKYWSLKPLFSFFLGVSKVKNRFEGVSFISQDILKTREMKGLQWKVF